MLCIMYNDSMSNKAKVIIMACALIASTASYLAWLNYECEAVGMMTWRGKICAENLTN